jgi:hypothetical protein
MNRTNYYGPFFNALSNYAFMLPGDYRDPLKRLLSGLIGPHPDKIPGCAVGVYLAKAMVRY